jgi:integrase/recombinase XerD
LTSTPAPRPSKRLSAEDEAFIRQVPLPPELLEELEEEFAITAAQCDPDRASARIWGFSRTTAWRYVKRVMLSARIVGTPAMPKGLRHGFGVKAFGSNVPPHLVQRWLGHASLRTTAIYGDVVGDEERAFAARMWINVPVRRSL